TVICHDALLPIQSLQSTSLWKVVESCEHANPRCQSSDAGAVFFVRDAVLSQSVVTPFLSMRVITIS
ncbi:MAG: hypothetical protein QUV35_07040, partial [Hydrogenophaga sp.]|uniref:hypothetical protein n=1 Tax=Hydrogenophaga sp. TaxID=1904254 RepID=UPI002602C6E7